MGMPDELVSAHFYHFDPSFKEHAQIRKAIETMPNAPRNGFYVCPLCMKNFLMALGDLLHRSAEFTKDHFPPQNAGGSRTLLVCEKCNSTAGAEYDYILEEFLRFCAFNKRVPNASLDMTHVVSAIPGYYKGRVIVDDTGQLEIEVKRKKKNSIAPLDKWIEKSKTDPNYTITMTIKEPLPNIVTRALLKTAYLYCFTYWGYEFACSDHGNKIRQVLRGEIDYPVAGGRLFIDDESKSLPEGLAFLQTPASWRSLVINIPLELRDLGYKCMVTVPVPAPTPTGWQDLESLTPPMTDGPIDVSMTPLPNYLVQGELYGYSRSWTEFNPK
jgi:hypothetical protein